VILTGSEIARQISCQALTIEPFKVEQLNPNSYNYRLSPVLRVCGNQEIQPGGDWSDLQIPATGLVLEPNRLYLGSTFEIIGSRRFVPLLIGRSSLGRLGVFLTISADMGNLGEPHRWTLEIKVVQPIRIYPQMLIGQVSFWKPSGRRTAHSSVYTKYNVPMESLVGDISITNTSK